MTNKENESLKPIKQVQQFSKTDEIIEEWFREHFHGTWISQDTQKFNQLRDSLKKLKEKIADAL
ncbi:hypothetical protein [Flavobacterium sp.]|jgi:hypothetical protein|uniref:hypothetical protein n=1 Tax=Flavobacterium sp. TaxID=239 RepID=UPI0037BEF07B